MDDFRTISTVLSIVLGLGLTRLLLGLVTVFRLRRASKIDWLPVAWAGVLFASNLEFWWAINYLPLIGRTFAFSDFIFLVTLTLMLFLSGTLVLPSRPEDETEGVGRYFERDGRYSLLAYAAFLALGFVANILFFRQQLVGAWSLLDIPLIVIPIVVFFTPSRRVRAWLTLAYIPLVAIDFSLSLQS